MRKLLFSLFAASLLFAVSCDKDPETTTLTVNFEPKFGDESFDLAKTYEFNGTPLLFDLFSVYVSDLALIKNDGTVEELSEIEYLGFSNPTGNVYTQSRTFNDIEMADYKGLRMGIGVKSSLNSTKPTDYASGHPLFETDPYWSNWNSYIFMRIQAKMDTEGNGIFTKPLMYHIGSDVTYRELSLEKALSIAENGSIEVDFDIKGLLTMDGQPFDIVNSGSTPHAAGNTTLAETLMSNIANMVTLK